MAGGPVMMSSCASLTLTYPLQHQVSLPALPAPRVWFPCCERQAHALLRAQYRGMHAGKGASPLACVCAVRRTGMVHEPTGAPVLVQVVELTVGASIA